MLVLRAESARHDVLAEALRGALGPSEYDEEASVGCGWSVWEALAYVDGLLEITGDSPGAVPTPVLDGPAATEPARPALRVRALGGLEVELNGTRPASEVWNHARPRELLAYLLSHPEGRTREQVGAALWPEASSTQVKNRFHVLLHKLRRGLGRSDAVVTVGERYRINPDADVWFDATTFDREVTAARRTGPASVARLESALALYRGDFLEGETMGDWTLAIQDRLRRLYVEGLSALADHLMARQEFAAAAEQLEVLVQKEELREDAYRRLMLCLARSGRRDQALRQFAYLTELLRGELDADPEPDTSALAARLAHTVGRSDELD
jgi:DNA-binding SARP family transcriptional activator